MRGILRLVPLLVLLSLLAGPILVFAITATRGAKRFGYPSAGAYLQAVPRSDAEKQDAADLAMRGLACCMLGMLFGPFVLVGLIPLFYGGRKLAYASMGLGLVDDADQPDV